MKRSIFDIALLLSLFILPWWCTLILAVIFLFLIEPYYEIIVVGFILDSLYNAPVGFLLHFQFVLTLFCLIMILLSDLLKRRLTFYDLR